MVRNIRSELKDYITLSHDKILYQQSIRSSWGLSNYTIVLAFQMDLAMLGKSFSKFSEQNVQFSLIRRFTCCVCVRYRRSEIPSKLQVGHTNKKIDLKDNPFYHPINLSGKQWAKTIVYGSVLVPTRMVLFVMLSFGAWIPYNGVLKAFNPQYSSKDQKFHAWFNRTMFRIFGVRAKIHGKKQPKNCTYLKIRNLPLT